MKRALVLVAACSHGAAPPATREPFDRIVIDTPPGISDLTLDDHGQVWAIAERDRFAVEMQPDGTHLVRHPIDGIPDGVDTEGLAYVGHGTFVIGTEGAHEPTASLVLAELRGDRLVATRRRELTNVELGVNLTANHGVEAVCGDGDEVLAVIETTGDDGSRWEPLVHLRGNAMTVGKLRLTSEAGKISALACRFAPDGSIEFHAIERHYKVSRIVHGTVAPGATDVAPAVELDLEPFLHDTLNLEGLVVLPDGHLEAVNDNQGSHVAGPTELLRFR